MTNWGPCRLLGMEWIEQYYMEDNPDRNSTLDALLVDSLDCSDDIMQSAQTLSRARDECPLGHLFYTATGLIMAAGAGRFTDDLPPYGKVVDQAIRVPWCEVMSSLTFFLCLVEKFTRKPNCAVGFHGLQSRLYLFML